MLNVVAEIIMEITGKEGVTYDTDFVKDLQLNSFDIVSVISAFEERYNIKIPTRDVWNLRTVRDVIKYLESRGIVA